MFTLRRFTVVLLITSSFGTAFAQEFESDLDCNAPWTRRDRQAHCEIRELTIPAGNRLSVDAGSTGSVRISGWDGDDVRVRAQVIAWAQDDAEARELLDEIVIRTDGVLRAERSGERRGSWAVSYEIQAPRGIDMQVDAANGAIQIADGAGALDVETTNGRIELADVSAAVRAKSTNGAISVTLSGRSFASDSIDLEATNGAVTLCVPDDFSADLDVRTVNGGIRVDPPIDVEGRARNWLEATLGGGGPPVQIRTTNGSVRIRD